MRRNVVASTTKMTKKEKHNEYMKAYIKERKKCDPEYADAVRATGRKSYHTAGKALRDERKAKGQCIKCGALGPLATKTLCQDCREDPEVARQRNRKVWSAILDHYGRECACCGETNVKFLTVDHINNDGAEQRRMKGGNNYRYYIYKDGLKGNWPTDLQILCFNCNCGKMRNNGVCPHHEAAPLNTH